MLIANPIYDSVFKYLLDDNKIAKLFISAIIGEEIEELLVSPTELLLTFNSRTGELISTPARKKRKPSITRDTMTVLRIDFAAKIKTAENTHKLVLIEIQKAKFCDDIMRFRKYLGENYATERNQITIDGRKEPIPIISLYFLGYKLDHLTAPVLHINRQCIDMATKEVSLQKESFIENLTHDSYIVQIPYLKEKRRNDLERLLSVFDQENIAQTTQQLLDIQETDVPEKYREVVRRLQSISADKTLRDAMQIEDQIISAFQQQQRIIEAAVLGRETAEQEREEALQEKEEALQREEQALQEKEEALQREEAALQEKERERQQREAAEEQAKAAQQTIITTIKEMAKAGLSNEQIAQFTRKTLDEIRQILSE